MLFIGLVALLSLSREINGSDLRSSQQYPASYATEVECPPTPDWSGVSLEDGVSFEDRYRDVHFEAPDVYPFDTSSSLDCIGWWNVDPVATCVCEDADTRGRRVSADLMNHNDDSKARFSRAHSQHQKKKKVSFALTPHTQSLVCTAAHDGVKDANGRDPRQIFHTDETQSLDISDDVLDAKTVQSTDETSEDTSQENGYSSPTDSKENQHFKRIGCKMVQTDAYASYRAMYHRRKGKVLVSKKERQKMKKKFEELWLARGLNYDMNPQDLALGVAKIKVKWTDAIDKVISHIATRKVRIDTSEDYFKRYRLQSRRLQQKLGRMRSSLLKDHPDYTERQKVHHLLRGFERYHERTFDEPKVTPLYIPKKEAESMQKASEAGAMLVEIASEKLNRPGLRAEDLSIQQIELYSRYIVLSGTDPTGSTNYLRRYLRKVLKKSKADLETFSMLRLEHQIAMKNEKDREMLRNERRICQSRANLDYR